MGKRSSVKQNVSRVTLKDISHVSGICLSSVSKALSGRSGVSEETRTLVLETAQNMGYRVNRLAQSLSRSDILIGVIAPALWPEYYGPLLRGIEIELKDLQDYRISAVYQRVSDLYSSADIVDALHKLVDARVNAIILCPNFACGFNEELDRIAQMNIPIVILGNSLRDAKALVCIRPNSLLAGKVAGEYMSHLLAPGKSAVIFIGNKNLDDHMERVHGFCSYPGIASNSNITSNVFETLDEPDVAYAITQKILRERRDVGGIYVATSNSIAVCECIRSNGMNGAVKVIGTDAFADMRPLFAENLLQGVLFQDPVHQGKLAVRVLFDYLTIKKEYPPEILINPQLVLSSNFSCYLEDNLAPNA